MSVVVHDLAFQRAASQLIPVEHQWWAQSLYNRPDLLRYRNAVEATAKQVSWDWAAEGGDKITTRVAWISVALSPTAISIEWETTHEPFPMPSDAVKGNLRLGWCGGYALLVEAAIVYAKRNCGLL